MITEKKYHQFIFLETLTRYLVQVFSLIILYQKGYSVNKILLFLSITYFLGIIINYLSLKYYYKYILILSSILYGVSYIYLNYIKNNIVSLLLLSTPLSISTYSYHTIKHYIALTKLNNRKNKNIIVSTYLGIIISTIIGTYIISKLSFIITSIIVFLLSIISILPIINIKDKKITYSFKRKIKISRTKYIYSILEQFKVIFIELQPLYLFIYIKESIYYIGLFNIITNLSSLIIITLFIKKYNIKYNSLILGIILLTKITINNSIILLLIAFLEGIYLKLYETNSLNNLYNTNTKYPKEYLLKEELIFFTTKTIIMLIFLLLNIKLKLIMYICIIGIIISGLFLQKNR